VQAAEDEAQRPTQYAGQQRQLRPSQLCVVGLVHRERYGRACGCEEEIGLLVLRAAKRAEYFHLIVICHFDSHRNIFLGSALLRPLGDARQER
jgi:hypothetical protein